ncbi:hypothetical protein BaRGS_00021745 [Batillaria attramentaria]|uniref:Uncharacterized protein n=1 Tax=Batillaria attramentaria TaxID=370345 RepID=A0ABD0KJY4_9CAEN
MEAENAPGANLMGDDDLLLEEITTSPSQKKMPDSGKKHVIPHKVFDTRRKTRGVEKKWSPSQLWNGRK